MRIALAAAALALLAPVASTDVAAHHSMAMFDMSREVTVSGTVRQFQWGNPHAYIQLTSKNDQGEDQVWSMEMGSPMYLYARGWRPRTLRPGSEVSVNIHPLRSGRPGGVVLTVTDKDGKEIGTNL